MTKLKGTGFEFDDSIDPKTWKKRHTYFFNGKRLTGVTTVLGMIAKDNLIQWAADMAAVAGLETKQITGIKKEYETVQYITDWKKKRQAKRDLDKKYPEYKEARTAHRKKKDETADIGIQTHKIIELIILDAIEKNNGYLEGKNIDFSNKQVKKMVENFLGWAVKEKVQFLTSEKKMYSEKHWIAGTCDFTCKVGTRGNKKYVGDTKTSGGIYNRIPLAQCAGYRLMLEGMGEKDFAGSVVVNLKKDGSFDSEDNVYWCEDYKEDLRLFMGALEIYRVMQNTKITN